MKQQSLQEQQAARSLAFWLERIKRAVAAEHQRRALEVLGRR